MANPDLAAVAARCKSALLKARQRKDWHLPAGLHVADILAICAAAEESERLRTTIKRMLNHTINERGELNAELNAACANWGEMQRAWKEARAEAERLRGELEAQRCYKEALTEGVNPQ